MKEFLKSKVSAASAVFAVVLLYVIMESLGITCPIKFVTGISCAGCGMSRAWLALLRLDFQKAFYFHPLFWLPPVFVVVFLFKKHIKKRIYHIFLFTIILLCAIVYLYRLIMGNGDIVTFHPENNLLFRIIRKIHT